YHLVLGDHVMAKLSIGMGLLLISLVAVAGLVLRVWRHREWTKVPRFVPPALVWMGILFLAYVGGIMVAMFSSQLDDLRYFLPVYPLLLAALGGITSFIPSRKVGLAVLAVAVATVMINSRTLAVRPDPAEHMIVRERLQEKVQSGQSMETWLRDHVTPADVLVAGDGQALEYVLQRPVVAIIEPKFSGRPTDGASFRKLMTQFGSRYLLLFHGMQMPYASPQNFIPFLGGLQSGNLPDWLKLAAQTRDVTVYECSSCAK
ncbi:MAG: hypothetical protein WCC92_12905, partial [Candidatus Korobacteraceae bacterium]